MVDASSTEGGSIDKSNLRQRKASPLNPDVNSGEFPEAINGSTGNSFSKDQTRIPYEEVDSNLKSSSSSSLTSEIQSTAPAPVSMEDKWSIVILLILYTLQGIPMGLCGSIPLLLKERGVSYEGLSLFSLVSLPFSMKLLWAPFVDSIYIKSIGRRKTWLLPVQMITGLVMVLFNHKITDWMGNPDMAIEPNTLILTMFFFSLYFLMATQDIAVDGWALTMLSRENVGYASTCNAIGQSFGFFLSNQGFIALSDAKWCERYLHLAPGETLVTLSGFMGFWGWVFIVVTILIGWGKSEHHESSGSASWDNEPDGVLETYSQVIAIFKLRPVQIFSFVLLTCKIAFSPADAVSGFKLQEYGMPKSDIATVSPILLIIGLALPAFMSSMVSKRPIEVFINGIGLKLFTTLLTWMISMYAKYSYAGNRSPGYEFFIPLVLVMVLHDIAGNLVFGSCMSFFAKISDPAIGGTYMTLLNTLANLGSKWPNSTMLWLLPKLTWSTCKLLSSAEVTIDLTSGSCASAADKLACGSLGGTCVTLLDGYTVETFVCITIGILWLYSFKDVVLKLQDIPHAEWLVSLSSPRKSS